MRKFTRADRFHRDGTPKWIPTTTTTTNPLATIPTMPPLPLPPPTTMPRYGSAGGDDYASFSRWEQRWTTAMHAPMNYTVTDKEDEAYGYARGGYANLIK